MDKHNVDFLREKHRLDVEQRRPFVFFGKFFITALIVAAMTGACLSFRVPSSSDGMAGSGLPRPSLFSALRDLFRSGDAGLASDENDRTNFLILGVGGEGHQGAELTDTIIFASARSSDKTVGMLSIPRDMTVPVPDEGWRKVNVVNALAEAREEGSGPEALIGVLEPIINQEIHYYLKVDFDGFAELIDKLGGVDVYVARSFTDSQYPIPSMEEVDCGSAETLEDGEGMEEGIETEEAEEIPNYDCRFQMVSFQEGWEHMDGRTALQYVRSRHGNNGESSDFARSRRQENLLLALKQKVLSLNTLGHPSKISAVLSALEKHIQTNLNLGEIIKLGQLYGSIKPEEINTQVLDTSEGGPLYSTIMNGAFVILPKNDNWSGVQKIAAELLSGEGAASSIAAETTPRFTRVEIQNGTTVAGLAFQVSQIIGGQGFNVTKIGNAVERNYKHTLIYDFTNGQKADDLKVLQELLKAEVSMTTTGWIYTSEVVPSEITITSENDLATTDNIDFLVILGENSGNLVRK